MITVFKRSKQSGITECIGFYKNQADIQKDVTLLYGSIIDRYVIDGMQVYEHETVYIVFKLKVIKKFAY